MNRIESMDTEHNAADGAEMVQKLVYGISHDMGAPLRAVIQFSRLLSLRLGTRLDDKESYWLQLIEDNGRHAQAMIDALLMYSRLATQRPPTRLFSLHESLTAAMGDQDELIRERCARIDVESTLPTLVGCGQHWRLVFFHILKNALQFQPLDSQHRPRIHIAHHQENGGLVLVIEDNGIGVEVEQMKLLTTPFKRLRYQDDHTGLGMGLTYAERIVQLHGGQMCFRPSSMNGLAVVCTLPLCDSVLATKD